MIQIPSQVVLQVIIGRMHNEILPYSSLLYLDLELRQKPSLITREKSMDCAPQWNPFNLNSTMLRGNFNHSSAPGLAQGVREVQPHPDIPQPKTNISLSLRTRR